MFWNTLYVPATGLEFPSISRHWAKMFGGWVVGEWDCFFGSLLTNMEDTAQTSAAVRAILLSQSSNGVVPNIDGGSGTTPDRSQPPVGSYAVWKNYEHNQDRDILEWAYPRLNYGMSGGLRIAEMGSHGETEIATVCWSGAAIRGRRPQ